jgi:hypothetical protein
MKLAPSSLDWALEHVRRHSDTDKFPHPFEVDVIGRQWVSVRAHLANVDLTTHRWSGERKMLVPKDAVSFRNAAQLDPLDTLLLAGLIYEVGAQIEAKRSPLQEHRVFSYRFAPAADGTLFGPDQWDQFWETSIRRASASSVVLTLDITDFYNQISHHSIENQLARCGLAAPVIKILMNLVKSSTYSVSKGIPVGPHPTHLLAEASLIPIDELLLQRGLEYCRYVDDINIFCDSEESAHVALFAVAGALDQYHKLTVNRSKTRILPSSKFVPIARQKADDQPINSEEEVILAIIKKYATGPYNPVPVSALTSEDLAQFSLSALEGILAAYLGAAEPDYVRLRFFLRRLSQVGVPGAVEYVVFNLSKLLPALAEVAVYLHSATPHYQGSWNNLGAQLLALLESPLAKESEYLQVVILGLFGRIAELNHIAKLTGRYASSSASGQREIVLAAAAADADAWLRTLKTDFSRFDPWLRRAFAFAVRALPPDERKFWIKEVKPVASPLELAILEDSKP